MVTRILSDNKELLRDLVEDESKSKYKYLLVMETKPNMNRNFLIIWLSNLLTMSVPGEVYSRNVLIYLSFITITRSTPLLVDYKFPRVSSPCSQFFDTDMVYFIRCIYV